MLSQTYFYRRNRSQMSKETKDELSKAELLEKEDTRFMKEAFRQAKKAYKLGEVPIGCVIVYEGEIIARGYNRRKTDKNTLCHAEITSIRRASRKIGDWRLEGCTLYVTLEPCQMCSGAIVQSRIDRVVIGCDNPKAGCAGSIINLLQMKEFNHQVDITRGVMGEECSLLLKNFFKELRVRLKKEKALKKGENDEQLCDQRMLDSRSE